MNRRLLQSHRPRYRPSSPPVSAPGCASSNSSRPPSATTYAAGLLPRRRGTPGLVCRRRCVGVSSIAAVQSVHAMTSIEVSTREVAARSVKQRLAALCHLFDWLVNGQVVPINPAPAAYAIARLSG
jgi:hypothetical protein